MYIKKVSVKGFKSLADFELELSPFTCLIGLNGCGKSTVLQFFDFIAHMLAGDVEKWCEDREWEPADVGTHGRENIEFALWFSDGSTWDGLYDIEARQCTRERIISGPHTMVLKDGKTNLLTIGEEQPALRTFDTFKLSYRGSITNLIRDDAMPPPFRTLKTYLRELRAFDTLVPQFLRRRDRQQRGTIGHSGEYLASYFDSMPEDTRERVYAELLELYPHLVHLYADNRGGGWKELVLCEEFNTLPVVKTRSRHINDGFLRMTAIFAELVGSEKFLLFDEIENGINPELIEVLLEKLTTSPHQVLVTTHSPMILNYLDDDLARQSVVFLYKGPDGATRARRFFEIPSISEKLDVMGPGEAFVDTNLVALTEELNAAVAGA